MVFWCVSSMGLVLVLGHFVTETDRDIVTTLMRGGEAGRFIGAEYFSACQVLVNAHSVKANTEGHVTNCFGVTCRCQIIFLAFGIRLN
jgi:hypothetical protein